MIANVLSIAGSDPSGGAGIQADLKAFSAMRTYGMAVITALTAQNTTGVRAVQELPAAFVAAQIDAVFEDVRIDAVKVGMIARQAVAETVAARLAAHAGRNVVLDPVMIAKSGDRLLDEAAVATLRSRLLPLARLLTPNLPEAGVLLGRPPPRSLAEMRDAARALADLGPRAVLLKGGHLDLPQSTDVLFDGQLHEFVGDRIATANTHGTGCTLSSAIAACVARGVPLPEAVAEAKAYLSAAIGAADRLQVGHGHGPVHHFHALWRTA